MDSKISLKISTGAFLIFLFISAFNHVDFIYNPLKWSIVNENIPAIWIYSAEFITFFIFGFSLTKLVNSIHKQKFFTKQNVNYLRIMAVSLILPSLVKTLGDIFDAAHDWEAFPMDIALWFAAALFLALMSNIFQYGLKLKEEQDLTI